MPDAVDVSASESSPLGGGGALELSDADILGIEDDRALAPTAVETPEAPDEAAAPASEATPPEAVPVEEVDDLKWMRPLLNDKAFGPKLQSMHDRLLAYQELLPKVADARAIKELLPEGVEGLKKVLDKSREVDEMDLQYFSRDPEEQRSFASNLYRDDPEAFQGMMQIGLDLIKSHNPQEYDYLTNHLAGSKLEAEKAWDWLEYVHGTLSDALNATTQEEWTYRAKLAQSQLNQFAASLQKFGLGPKGNEQDPNLQRVRQAQGEFDTEKAKWQRERQQEFTADTDRNVTSALDTDIGGHLLKLLPKASDGLRGKIAKEVHSDIQKAIGSDAGLKLRLANLMRTGGTNRQTQEQVTNLLVSKARLVLPGAVKRVVSEYTRNIMASRNEVTEKQTAAASRVDVSSGARPGTGVKVLTREEAMGMSDLDILESSRPVAKRK